ncbi:chemotaxis protein [Massilia sp. NEAU-DD11]|uniref:Chemotaxis protein n=1 Tax=Massilia cellulosiltytica TaxID=2683234 RepID=A0A7X3K7G2_9BURK|nr:methyl-accepting chemotaxis protein [Telluria cellulosilytica]MVW59851.1 chemotaxis protein [Telluria cellulosilytica]
MHPTSSCARADHANNAGKLFLAVLWALFATSLALGLVYDSLMPAVAAGLPLALVPSALIAAAPGSLAARLSVAVALMLFCALNIHQAHGLTELHFGIFVLLAFLVCYQDWRVIVAAAGTAAVHHLTFNYLQEWGYPTLCFTHPGIGIVLLHAVYVVVEAAVLSYLAVRLQRETTAVAASAGTLHDTLRAMRSSADQVARDMDLITQTSSAVAAGSADLSARAAAQAARLGQAAAAVDHLTATVKRNVDHAALAVKGGDVVADVVQTMEAIRSSSREVQDIVNVIDGIAFQTNILALNAAVEAARAGEQGRGFAVVAGEVRSLAQRSAQAAKEVRQLIGDSAVRVDAGGRLVDEAGQAMHQIVGSVQRVAGIMTAISGASQEQRDGIEQVRDSIREIEVTTRQTAELVGQSADAAETMCAHASSVARAVGTLRQAEAAA